MKQSSDKKEFWVWNGKAMNCPPGPITSSSLNGIVHVIEYSTLTEALAETQKWKDKYIEARQSGYNEGKEETKERDEHFEILSRRQVTELAAAKEEIARLKDISNVYGPAMKALDGVAVVNLAEPSEGDLERVVKAYAECRRERDEFKKEVNSLKESMNAHDKSRAKVMLEKNRLRDALWKIKTANYFYGIQGCIDIAEQALLADE